MDQPNIAHSAGDRRVGPPGMEEQIVKSLIEFYREQGIDLYAVVDDPLFATLPVPRKVEMLKHFAAEIKAGTHTGLSTGDIKSVLANAAVAGASTGALSYVAAKQVLAHFNKGQLPGKAIAYGIGAGAAISAVTALLNSTKRISQRNEIHSRLENLANTPTDNNAIKLLAMRGQQVHPNTNVVPTNEALNSVKNVVQKIPTHYLTEVIPNHIEFQAYEKNIPIMQSQFDINDIKTEDDLNRLRERTQSISNARDQAQERAFNPNLRKLFT